MIGRNKDEGERQAKAREVESEKLAKQKEKIRKIQEESESEYAEQVAEKLKTNTRTLPNEYSSQTVDQAKMEEEKQVKKKADYIDEKSKLSEKQLLAEIILLLENIRNDAKINSENVNHKLSQISKSSEDAKYELKYTSEDDKKRHQEIKDRMF